MRLMFILACVISGFVAIALVFFQATRKTYPGFDRWTAGAGFLTLGYLLMCLRGFIPEPLSIVLGNVAFPLGMVLQLDGIRRFLGARAMPRLWYALPGIDLVAVAILYYLHDSPAWRHMVTGVAISVPHWAIAVLVLRHPVKHKSMFYPVIGSTIGLAGVVVLARPMATFLLPQWHLLMDSPFQIGSLAALIVLQLGENLSMIMLNGERVESELVETETQLRLTVNRLLRALTEQKRTEESLRESEERYRTFFDTSRDCVFMTTVDGRFIDFNDAGLEMLGYSPGDRLEMLRKNVASFYANPEERKAHSQRVQAMGFSKDHPVDFRKKDGTVIHALVTTVARKDIQGNIVGFQGIVKDITERKQAQEVLRQSEERLNRILGAATDGFWDWDLVTGNIWRSPGWTKILGYSLEETEPDLGGWDKLVHPDDLPRVMQAINEHLAGLTSGYTNEYRMLKKSGEWAWIEDRGKVVERDDAGKPLSVAGAFQDISLRKRAENELRESEEKFRSLFETSLDGILLTAPDGQVFNANPAACQILGWSEQELREMGRDAVVDSDDPRLLSALAERNRIGRFSGELNLKRRDGSIFPVELSSALFTTANNNLRANIVIRDITERKSWEEALKASEEKYRLLVEKAREVIFVVQDTVFRYVNPAAEEILGFTADQLLGNSFEGIVHPDDRETVVERHYRRLNGAILPSRYEIRIIDGQDRVKWAEIDSMLIEWEGKPAVMVFLTDITYRRLAEEAAMQTERLQAIARLSTGVAHHCNNLLQIVMGSASLSIADLESGDLSEIKPTLERMLEATRSGSEMVKRLQTFADVRFDITDAEAATFDVATTARNAAEVSEPLWKAEPEKRGTKVNLQLDLEEGCLVQGNENEMLEVFVNLLRNAAEAMPDGGDIEVKAFKEVDKVVITVRDTGIGIAENDLPRVFEPFWSSKGVAIGKGMGLAMTHGLVKRHGGAISVQSKVGAGTTFTIRLPLAQEPVTETEQPAKRPAEGHLAILVIEDELHIATLLERILTKAGHRVFRALSGDEGLAIFRKEHVNMILCDLGMPGMSGWDVGEAIQSACHERGIVKPPFILLTGWGGQELEKEKIAESGTDAVVAKPIDSAALLATVQEIAERFT